MSPTAAPTGVLEIEGKFGEGEIYVDGAFFGNTPGRLVLVPGKHVVEIRRLGFKPYRRELFIGAGDLLRLCALNEPEER